MISRQMGDDTTRGADEEVGRGHRDRHARRRGASTIAIAGEHDATHSGTECRHAGWKRERERWGSHRIDLGR